MNIIEFMEELKRYYNENRFERVLQEIEKYLKSKDHGVFDYLLSIYIESLIKLGRLEDAYKNVELMREYFPTYYSDYDLAIKYSECGKKEKLEEILSNGKISDHSYYYLARNCFYNGHYDKALELFNLYLKGSEVEEMKVKKVNEFIRKLKLYKENKDVFREMSYSYFKSIGNKLEPGYVIYVDRLRNEFKENYFNTDPKSEIRPYMIWKIIDGKVYAFSLSTKIRNTRKGILKKEDYPVRNFDRVARSDMVCLRESDVNSVIDKISYEDYEEIIGNIYRSVSMQKDVPKKSVQFFIKTITSEISVSKNNVLVIKDLEKNKKRFYYVVELDYNKKKYKVIELDPTNEGFKVLNKKLSSLSMKTPILSVIELSNGQINNIESQIPDNFKDCDMLGCIIEYQSRRLEIIMEKEDFYICIDKTLFYSPTYIDIEFIRKDVPLTIVDRVDDDTYEGQYFTLKHYLEKNSNVYSRKRDSFLRYHNY